VAISSWTRSFLAGLERRVPRNAYGIYVRTDWREPTLSITKTALKIAFPTHQFKRVNRPLIGETQTRLFGHYDPRFGEVDLVLRLR